MIRVENLTYDYPDKRALNNVSFDIQEGTITALVGPNGSGKTTLLRSVAALSRPFSGEIRVNGFNAATQPHDVHLQLGYLQDIFGLYDQLTVTQSLEFMAYSRLQATDDIDEAIETAIQISGIETYRTKKVSTLSRGMRQRVGIALAILHKPKVLLLDEPASGLDPEARYELSNLLLGLRNSGMTIVVSSHILAELEEYSTGMIVLQEGCMVEHRLLKAVNDFNNFVQIEIGFTLYEDSFAGLISAIEGVIDVEKVGNYLDIVLDTAVLPKHMLLSQLIRQGLMIEEFSTVNFSLQDEYIKTIKEYKQGR